MSNYIQKSITVDDELKNICILLNNLNIDYHIKMNEVNEWIIFIESDAYIKNQKVIDNINIESNSITINDSKLFSKMYYNQIFSIYKNNDNISFNIWNWNACIFSWLWLFYKRLFVLGIFIFVIEVLIFLYSPLLSITFSILFCLFCGIFGNKLYYKKHLTNG